MNSDNNQEMFPLVDEQGNITGAATRGECHSGSKLLHPVIHLHVFNSQGELYLQKRPEWKDIQPGKWDTSVGGHIDLGESVEMALRREVREELGITEFTPETVTHYVFESSREKELVFVHKTVYDGEIHPSDELDGGRFWTIEEIKEIEIVGKKRQYYVLKFAIGNMVTNVPIENSEEIGIRPVIEKQEAKKALQYFRDAELEDDANWNKRQRNNLIKIKSGDIYQVILVLKELMYREKIKGLSTSERKTLTSAKQIVVSELVLSEVADVSDIESILNDTVDALV